MVRPSIFRRFEVDHQRIPPGLRHREFGGLAALPGCVDQYGALLKQVRIVCPIGDEAAGL